jgi:N-acetyllactosaminide 3-alpha-galactosyltransferase
MKIAMLVPYFYPHTGGTEKYVKDLSLALIARGHQVTVFTTNTHKAAAQEDMQGINVIRLPAVNLDFMMLPVSLPFNLKLLKGYDIVHSHGPSFGFTKSVGKKAGIPHVLTFHCDTTFSGNLGHIPMPKFSTNIVETLGNRLGRTACRMVDAIISTTESYASSSPVLKGFKYHAIPIGIHTGAFDTARDKGGITEESRKRNQVLFVGRLVANKGVDYLVKAVSRVKETVPNVHLVICGEGEQKPFLVKLIKDLGLSGNVTFYGKVSLDIITHLYSTSTMFVLPSVNRLEAFGIVQLEAMACETPVIASEIPGVKDVMDVGKSGLLVPKENVEALSKAIHSMLSNYDKTREMGRYARKLVLSKYNWEIIAGQVEGIYTSLIKK